MGVLASALTSLDNAKLLLGVTGTAQDALVSLLINRASAAVRTFTRRKLTRATYTEKIPASGTQRLLLNEWPIVSITSLKDNDYLLTLDDDYRLDDQDKRGGWVFREQGWAGSYGGRGLTSDPVFSSRNIDVIYVAGYYLPADVGYVEGADASLPIDIQSVVEEEVVQRFTMAKAKGFNLSSYSEGGISMSWQNNGDGESGLSKGHEDALRGYRRMFVA